MFYEILMTLIFKPFGVSLDGELVDNDVLSWDAKNVVALKLSPQPGMEKACMFSDEEEDQNKDFIKSS